MKTRNENKTVLVNIETLNSGSCFLAKRTGSQDNGVYIKVDKNSGPFISDTLKRRDSQCILALNVETGQLRKFNYDTKVTPLPAAELVY